MTKSKRSASRSSSSPVGKRIPTFLPPIKPRPKLVVLLGAVLALWLAALVVMRLTTVHRPAAPATEPIPAITQ